MTQRKCWCWSWPTATKRTGSSSVMPRDMMWPHIEREYREEMQGISAGLQAKAVELDLWDVVALNAFCEWEYYVKEYDRQHRDAQSASLAVPEHCSAFVATGSYTKDGKVIIAHNNWTT